MAKKTKTNSKTDKIKSLWKEYEQNKNKSITLKKLKEKYSKYN